MTRKITKSNQSEQRPDRGAKRSDHGGAYSGAPALHPYDSLDAISFKCTMFSTFGDITGHFATPRRFECRQFCTETYMISVLNSSSFLNNRTSILNMQLFLDKIEFTSNPKCTERFAGYI